MADIEGLEEKYDLELDKVISKIKEENHKKVLLQFPEGLKPYATKIVDYLRECFDYKVEFIIWLESCFGACDTPVLDENTKKEIDLVVQFGHNEMMPEYKV